MASHSTAFSMHRPSARPAQDWRHLLGPLQHGCWMAGSCQKGASWIFKWWRLSNGHQWGAGCQKGGGGVSSGCGWVFWVAIVGVDVAVETGEERAMLRWQPSWWRCLKMWGPMLMWQPMQGQWMTTGSSVMWHVVGCKWMMRGWWGGKLGCYSPGGTLFPLLLTVLLAVQLVVAQSIVVVVVESIICGWNALAWLA